MIDRNGNLPSAVQIYYWFDGEDQANAQRNEMKYSDDRMVHRLENVTRSLKYRAEGGDDDTMEWISLEVVEPPRVESLAVRLHPPKYTAWPPEPSGGNIHALVGTVVELRGRLSEPASVVNLIVDDREVSPPVPIQIDADGLGFGIEANAEPPWTITESGEYGFQITDPAGLSGVGEARWTIRAIPDERPIVSLEKPSANSFVTPNALVPLQGVVRDDVAVHSISIHYRRGDAGSELDAEIVPVFEGSNRPLAAADRAGIGAASEHVVPVDYDWDLSEMPGLKPGLWIDFELVADDYKPQTERSTSRRLTIISISELEERISARRSFILGQLAEVLRVQREVRSETKSLDIAWEELGQFRQLDVDRLQSAELRQRQVGELLSDPSDGVETQITTLLDELRGNRIDSQEVDQRMSELLGAVREISRQMLPEIQRELIAASKAARQSLHAADDGVPPTADPSVATSLNSAGQQQAAVIAALEKLLGDFSQWDNYHRFSRELIRLRQTQDEVRQDTERMRLETLAKDFDELTPEQRAGLRRIGLRQTELAREFVRIQSRMEQIQAELVENDPVAAETLADTISRARQTAVGGQMRDTGRRIDNHQLGPATNAQQRILQNLQDLIDTLVNRREHELQRRVDKLTEAETELQELRRRQKELKKKLDQAAA
ncbi:MAG: hypothetical protein JJ992_13785, partial [Planctomycetes bacterium]|nr:hypothetical protein [Planctomycetota bacterium]